MTTRFLIQTLLVCCVALSAGSGCVGNRGKRIEFRETASPLPALSVEKSVDAASTFSLLEEPSGSEVYRRPLTSKSELPSEFVDISLDEAVALALQDVQVLRSLSANVVQNTQSAASSLDPALQATNPNFGIQAALAAFDTNLTSSILYDNNDDTFNNPSTTGNAVTVQQDLTNFNLGLNKVSAYGTQFSVNNTISHDSSSNPALLFGDAWNTSWEATVRHPLLQGSGVLFNRIAGPTSRPGFNSGSGLLISRSNHDISVAEFERNVRQMVLEIVNAYWQLDLAYQNFETVKAARDGSLETWNIAKSRMNNGLPGGEADREAQARSQYYSFEAQLKQNLNRSQANGSPGVLQAESNLRRLLRLPQSDGLLLRPSDQPTSAGIVVDWDSLAAKAVRDRVEVQQQRMRVEQAELLLIAAKSFTLPRLDAIATYRNSGFGDDLIGDGSQFSGALNEAWLSNFDEWSFGFALDVPIGYRQANAGVRNAQLQVIRERAVLSELKEQLMHGLGTALRDFDQSFDTINLVRLQNEAASDVVESRRAAYRADAVGFEDLLDAQQRLLDSELAYHNSKTDYELALAQLNSESGQLLNEFSVHLNEDEIQASCRNCATRRTKLLRLVRQNNRLKQPVNLTK